MENHGKAQNRITPGYRGAVGYLVIGVASILFFWFILSTIPSTSVTGQFVFTYLCIGAFVYVLFSGVKKWRDTKSFHSDSCITTGTVIDRQARRRRDSYGHEHTSYEVIICFTAGNEVITLKANVTRYFFESARPTRNLEVQYARTNPRVALFEGEPLADRRNISESFKLAHFKRPIIIGVILIIIFLLFIFSILGPHLFG